MVASSVRFAWACSTFATPYGADSRCVLRQHHCPVVHQEAGGNGFCSVQSGGSIPPPLGRIVRVTMMPEFIMGAKNVVADSLSCRQQVLGSEWTFT